MMSKKTVKAYEREAVKIGKCLIYPSSGNVARRLYQRRHNITLPPSIFVCHTCDNPRCIRDSHHFLGTHIDNMRDMTKKGRKIAAMNTPEVLARLSAASVAAMSKPGAREKKSAEMLQFYADHPEARIAMSKSMRRYYRKPGSIEKQTAAMNKPEVRALLREVQLVVQNRPEIRANKSKMQRAVMMKPAMRKRNSANMRAYFAKPGARESASAAAYRRFENPAEREKLRAAQNALGVNERRSASIKRTLALPKNKKMTRDRVVLGWETRRRNGNA
jgi:hypothetical protein